MDAGKLISIMQLGSSGCNMQKGFAELVGILYDLARCLQATAHGALPIAFVSEQVRSALL